VDIADTQSIWNKEKNMQMHKILALIKPINTSLALSIRSLYYTLKVKIWNMDMDMYYYQF